MADWIYCGTIPPVDADGTQNLFREHQAIWCSPPGLRPWPGTPTAGDRIWLVWRDRAGGPILLLGNGSLVGNAQPKFGTNLLHTDTDFPGDVRTEAMRLGYGGGSSMSFLRLQNLALPITGHPVINGLGPIPNALSEANDTQREILEGVPMQLQG